MRESLKMARVVSRVIFSCSLEKKAKIGSSIKIVGIFSISVYMVARNFSFLFFAFVCGCTRGFESRRSAP